MKRNLFSTKDNFWWNQKYAYCSTQAGSFIMFDVALKEKMNKTKEKEKSTQVSLY